MDPAPTPVARLAPVDDVLYDVAVTPGMPGPAHYDQATMMNAAIDGASNPMYDAATGDGVNGGADEYLDVGDGDQLYDQTTMMSQESTHQPQLGYPDVESSLQPVYGMAVDPVASPQRPRLPTLSVESGLSLPPDWHEATDAEGTVYFYNSVTQESAWDRPVAAGQVETNL